MNSNENIELDDTLLREGERRVKEVWEKTEEEEKSLRQQAQSRFDALLIQVEEEVRYQTATAAKAVGNRAKERSRIVRLVAEQSLGERLNGLALGLLPQLRLSNYAQTFKALIAELPPDTWETVHVNPADEALLTKHFATARVVSDKEISGGLAVTACEGQVQITNTFEKRLDRAWPQILPGLIDDVREMVDVASSTTD